eukprot:13274416-Alexandrium_andersonii.AAC.1
MPATRRRKPGNALGSGPAPPTAMPVAAPGVDTDTNAPKPPLCSTTRTPRCWRARTHRGVKQHAPNALGRP